VAYTQIVTISTDDHYTSQEFRASVGAQWPFLSDPKRTVQQDLDVGKYTDPKHDPMVPHALVLKPGLVILGVDTLFLAGYQLTRSTLPRPILQA
jgi:peroxiredoxin